MSSHLLEINVFSIPLIQRILELDYLVCSHYSSLKWEQNKNAKGEVINIAKEDSIIFNIKRCFQIVAECFSYEQEETIPKRIKKNTGL